MRILVFLTSAILLHTFSLQLLAQHTDYKLLWEISGNGLEKPSFLFGTIHIQDKRAFEFSDSVLLALEACETFAMELHPDSVVRQAFRTFFKSGGVSDKPKRPSIRTWLTQAEYDSLAVKFRKKTGFELRQFEHESPLVIEGMMEEDTRVAKDKATFLDAWLSQMARVQGKRIVGLETYQEQIQSSEAAEHTDPGNRLKALLGEPAHQTTRLMAQHIMMDQLIERYRKGDIDQIYAYYERYAKSPEGQQYVDHLLVRRNRNMYERLVPEIHRAPTFIAVGTAHLPGEEGLIELLKKGGYRMRPVTATFTGVAAKYTPKKVAIPWKTYTNETTGYSLQMPQFPFSYSPENLPVDMYLYPELGTGLVYMTMSLPLGDKDLTPKTALEAMISKMTEDGKSELIKKKKIRFEGHEGRQFVMKVKDEGYMKGNLVFRQGHVYFNMLQSQRLEMLESEYSKRFFESLKFLPIPQTPWQGFESDAGAFALKCPPVSRKLQKLVHLENDSTATFKLHIFMAVDAQSGNTYVFRYNDMPNGHYMLDQQEYLNDITLDLQNSMQAKIVKQEERNFFGYPGRYLLLDLSGTPIHGQLCTRDNRFYLQLAFESEVGKHQDDIHAFLNSFELLPFQPASWAPYSPPGAGFSISMPGEVMIEADSVSEYQMDFPLLRDRIYSASDTNSGMVYSLYIRQHAPYFTYEDEHTFYTRVEEFVQADEGDSLIFENSFHWMGVPVKEFVYQSPAYTYLKRVRVIPWGDKLYMLWAIVSRQAVNAGPTEDFFHSLQLDRTANSGQLFVAAKVAKERMMADILQADSSRRLLLNDYLRQYDGWTAADLPELHRMLEAISPQAPSAMQSTKKQLIRALGEVYDEGSTALLWKEYERYADTSHIRHSLLVALAQQHQADQWPALLQRLYADQPEMAWEDKNDFFAPLKFDTTGMLASLLPHLMPLMERPHFARELYEVLEHALESHQLQPAHLQPYLPALSRELSLTADSLELAPLDTNDYAYLNRFYWQCELWQHLPLNAEATAALQRGQSGYAEFLHFSAIKALLKNGVTPDSAAFSTLAEDGYFRKELFELLDTLDQIQLLPQPYQNQQAMAQAYLEHAGYEYDEIEPDTMVFVEKRTIEINGHTGIIYLYKMGYFVEAEEAGKTVSINWYPGLSGLFPSDGGLRPLQNLCWPYWEKWEEMESSQAFIALWKEKMQQDDP